MNIAPSPDHFKIVFRPTMESMELRHDELGARMARRVVGTLCNRLIVLKSDGRSYSPVRANTEIPPPAFTVVCEYPGMPQPLPVVARRHRLHRPAAFRRNERMTVASLCAIAIDRALYATRFRHITDEGVSIYNSGVEPIARQDLEKTIAGLSSLRGPLPITSEAFSSDVAAGSQAIFDLVTGGEGFPAMRCYVEREEIPPVS